MTFRGVIFGLLGAVFIGTAGYVTSFYRVPSLTRGHLPISVFGVLFVLMAAVNPLLHKIRAGWRLRSSEIAVALAMALVACNIPSAGLMRTFSSALVMPVHFSKMFPGWRSTDVVGYAPPGLLVDVPPDPKVRSAVIGGFISGLGRPGHPIGAGDVPWANWATPLAFWLTFIILAALATMSMSLIVHRQWAHRERLRYPIADFSNSLIEQDPRRAAGPIFRNKLFWTGAILLLSIRVFNCVNTWTHTGVQVPFKFELEAIKVTYPVFAEMSEAEYVIKPLLIPTAVAFTFFLASDIGLSMGLASLLTVAAQYIMLNKIGMTVTAAGTGGGVKAWVSFGAFIGYTVVLLFIGRRYYLQTLKAAILPGLRTEVDRSTAWAARLFVLSCLALTLILSWIGVGVAIALITVTLVMVTFLVLARINAECGVFFFKPSWTLLPVFAGLFGAAAFGPTGTIVVGMVMIILLADPFESLIPYVINGLKIADKTGVSPGRTTGVQVLAFVVALALAIPVGLWADYNFGRVMDTTGDRESTNPVGVQWSKVPFSTAEKGITKSKLSGQLAQSVSWSSLDRLRNMRPHSMFLWSTAIGLAGVLVLGGLRLRYPWWPLHPILLLGYGAWTMGKFGASFLLGWLIKSAVMRLGGPKAYHHGRYFMTGVIAGDLCGGLVYMATMYAYHALTGLKVPSDMPLNVLW